MASVGESVLRLEAPVLVLHSPQRATDKISATARCVQDVTDVCMINAQSDSSFLSPHTVTLMPTGTFLCPLPSLLPCRLWLHTSISFSLILTNCLVTSTFMHHMQCTSIQRGMHGSRTCCGDWSGQLIVDGLGVSKTDGHCAAELQEVENPSLDQI